MKKRRDIPIGNKYQNIYKIYVNLFKTKEHTVNENQQYRISKISRNWHVEPKKKSFKSLCNIS